MPPLCTLHPSFSKKIIQSDQQGKKATSDPATHPDILPALKYKGSQSATASMLFVKQTDPQGSLGNIAHDTL